MISPDDQAAGPGPVPRPGGEPPDAVTFDGVGMTYSTARGPVHALADITLAVPSGHFVSIVGPSGCGKSSLLLATAGLRSCTAGRILIGAVPVAGPQPDTGIVFQTDTLLDWRSALDNVLLQVELRRLGKNRYRQRALDLLQAVGLGGFEFRHPYELSGGMRQRIAICRALIHDPQLLLMDEPFGALDALTRDQMMTDLQSLWLEHRKTVLFITHSIPEAIFLSDRVVVMSSRPGRIDDIVDIALPRPRGLAMTTEPEFNGYVLRIRQVFERRGVLAGDPGPGRVLAAGPGFARDPAASADPARDHTAAQARPVTAGPGDAGG